ncbi:MAG: T9SS type A sorting domain-containing protein, partial [Rhodothermales bacterium]|nr:T9SS type A sorting domain-containing protein [Rhodothermales bacterium]
SEDGSYLWPYVIYTTVGQPSTQAFEARDVQGQPVAGTIEFFGYDTSHITINADGTVTGQQEDSISTDYSGTRVWARVDGDTLQYPAHVKVLSQTYNFDYIEVDGGNVTLYYPRSIDGTDYQSLVEQYDYLDLLDQGYEVEKFLTNSVPHGGQRQIVTIEPEEDYDFRHCRNLVGTLRLTYEIGGSDFSNCFMIPYLPGKSPRTDVVYHEFGHAFQLESNVYARSMGNNFIYTEAWANLMFTAVPQIFNEDPASFPLSPSAVQASQAMYDFKVDQQSGRFDDWIASGAALSDLNSNIVHGIALHHRGDRPVEFYQRFFLLFQNEFEDDLNDILEAVESNDSTGVHTFFAAQLSAVVQQDLLPTFRDDYNYPLDSDLFDTAFDRFTQILDASIFTDVEEIGGFAAGSFDAHVFPNPVISEATFRVDFELPGPTKIDVYDSIGRRILRTQIQDQSRNVSYRADFSSFPAGVYFYRVSRNSSSTSGSFVLSH